MAVVRKGWHGWVGHGAVPHLLPAPLGEAEPPEVTRESRLRERMLH